MRFSVSIRFVAVALALALIPSFSFATLIPVEGTTEAQGPAWQSVTPPSSATMYAIDLSSPTEGWTGGMAGFMFRYSGGAWAGESTEFDSPIIGLDMVSDTSGWGVNFHGRVIRYTGSTWSIYGDPDNPPSPAPLDDISMVSDTEGFAVGGPDSTGHGTIIRCVGGVWAQVASPSTYWLRGIDMLSATDGWAVGIGGTILHWDGGSWQGGSILPGVGLLDVDAVSAADAWAVGIGGVIYHYDGSTWQPVTSPTTNNLNAIQMINSSQGWAFGDYGTILRYVSGTWAVDTASPTTKNLYAAAFAADGQGWATGKDGVLLHYVPQPASLSTSQKSVDRLRAAPGQRLSYTISLANSGDLDATGVQVTDPVPDGASFVPGSAHSSQGTIQEPVGSSPLVASIGTLPPGGTATVTFQLDADDTGPACWFVANQATIGHQGGATLTRGAVTIVGTCHQVYLPLTQKH